MGVALFVAAVAGGGVAVTLASVLGVGEHTTTVREVVPAFQPSPGDVTSRSRSGRALTLGAIYKNDAPAVVQVTSTTKVDLPRSAWFGNSFAPGTEVQRYLGSGFVIDKAGYIVTNSHVVADAPSLRVSFANGAPMKVQIVGLDPSTDIALLKVGTSSRALKPLALGNSDAVQVGDQVAAIGNPLGYDRSISAGIVSALQRSLTAPNGSSIDRVIQTDAPLNHGNSGGPLLNAQGQVIGVTSAVNWGPDSQANTGVGFAIPINTVRDVVAQLKVHGRVDHPLFGVVGRSVTSRLRKLFLLPAEHGVLVERILPGSGAEQAGLRGGTTQVVVAGESYRLGGDLIVKAGDQNIDSTERLSEVVSQHAPGDTLSIEYYRGSERRTADVKLGRQPPTPLE
ncbi:MAG: trypsin-like peptidase domain-containing protein [Actinomycetota bacterium]